MEAGLEEAFETTLDAISKIQRDVSMMLGAKAVEAEKVRNWVLNHVKEGVFQTQLDRFSTSMQFHEQQIEVIDGLAKMCNGLSRSMRIILHPDQDENQGMPPFPGGYLPEEPIR
ncbi:restriction endonuclease subunit S [Cohnella caldifontis]|uniref:restriction endonuclease subunit S n=1 Tax=Cohnella caldifontis TaxID=3027471 RepID=UPI0023EA9254|nr:restriction endonuclease subunit S [Cohnella sp. YIM B05605]